MWCLSPSLRHHEICAADIPIAVQSRDDTLIYSLAHHLYYVALLFSILKDDVSSLITSTRAFSVGGMVPAPLSPTSNMVEFFGPVPPPQVRAAALLFPLSWAANDDF